MRECKLRIEQRGACRIYAKLHKQYEPKCKCTIKQASDRGLLVIIRKV